MKDIDFRLKLRNSLLELNFGHLVEFAWICAVRSILFLSTDGTFECWNVEKRQINIYNIFRALDLIKGRVANGNAIPIYSSSYATNSAFAVAYSFDAFLKGYNSDVNNLLREAPEESILLSVSAACVLRKLGIKYSIDFETIIFDDIKNIRNENRFSYNDIVIYGEVWNTFEKALNSENCSFWYQLYKSIFENKFVVDMEMLKKRIYIPNKYDNSGASTIAEYLKEVISQGEFQLNEARIIILGDKGAGKTSIARRLSDPQSEMPKLEESTAGVDTAVWKIDDKNVNVHIWDFAGHTVTHAVHQFFLSDRCLYILVCDGKTDDRERLVYWLNHIKNYGGNSEVMILVNKKDRHTPDIPENTLKEQYPIVSIHKFSIKCDISELNKFRNTVVDYVTNHPSWNKKEVPLTYYQVKQRLEEMFDKGNDNGIELISKDNFDKIARKYSINGTDGLLKSLHELGVGLWYKSLEAFDTLILNPEWISHGVYQIINWAHENKKYELSLNDFESIFSLNRNRYPSKMYKYLFDLMVYYELAYEIDEKALVIPHLLKEDRPEFLPVFPEEISLMLKYQAEYFLPPNTISRFIVRHNQEIAAANDEPLVWRYGVVLTDRENNVALVREIDRSITVAVKGAGKTMFLDKLRYTLNEIFKSYQSKMPDLLYHVSRKVWIPDEQILNHVEKNRPYYDYKSGADIDMKEAVEKFHITVSNSIGNNIVINSANSNNSNNANLTFEDCKVELDHNLKVLYEELMHAGYSTESLDVSTLRTAIAESESTNEWKEKETFTLLSRFVAVLKNPDSIFYKRVENLNNGVTLIENIGRLCHWLSLFF